MRIFRAILLCLSIFVIFRPALAAPPVCNATSEGTLVYNKDHLAMQFCNGTDWISMSGVFGAGSGGLPALTSANIWVGNGTNVATAVTMSGDATMNNAGALTIGSNAIGSAEIMDSTVASADIAVDSIVAADIATGGVATAEILDATIALGDLSATGTASGTTFLRGDNTWATPSVTETDPQVGTTTASNFCKANVGGTAIDCATAAIVSADITDSTVASADIAVDTIVAADIATGGVATAEILDATIALGDLSATGTANSTTFLRGDNTWAAPGASAGGSSGQLQINASGSLAGAAALTSADAGPHLTITAQGASYKPLVVKSAASQTANLQEWQNSSSSVLANVTAAGVFSGSGAGLTALNATNLSSGTVATARLGTGTANNTTFLRGDNTWATPSGGSIPAGTWCGLSIAGGSITPCNGTDVSGGACPSGYTIRTFNAEHIIVFCTKN